MHVDLEDLVVLVDDQRIADAVQIQAQRQQVHIGVPLAHHVDGVEDVDLRHKHVLRREDRLLLLLLCGGAHLCGAQLAPQGGQDGLQDDHIALAAGVDDTGFFQHRVLVHCVLQSLIARLDGGAERVLQAGAALGGLARRSGGQAGDGEDGALGGLHHGLVGGLHALVHGPGELLGPGAFHALEALGDAPEQQAQNHAGVAPGAPQHGAGHAVRRGGHVVKVPLAKLGGGVVDGKPHVGAGIAVRHGEHVQIVDGLDLGLQGRVRESSL